MLRSGCRQQECVGCGRSLNRTNDPYSDSVDGVGDTCVQCRAALHHDEEAICRMWVLERRLKQFTERYKVPEGTRIEPVTVPWWEYEPTPCPALLADVPGCKDGAYPFETDKPEQQKDVWTERVKLLVKQFLKTHRSPASADAFMSILKLIVVMSYPRF